MKRLLIYGLAIVFFSPLVAQNTAKVTILGVHHFANPGADMFNIHQDDIKAPKRQKEVLELVDLLLEFQPTKVVLERAYDDDTFQEKYEAYLQHRSDDSLTANERQQLGFRIAAKMGHDRIYPFDYKKGMNLAELEVLASKDPSVAQRFQAMMTEIGTAIKEINDTLKESTLLQFLTYMNLQESVDLNHQSYLNMLQMTGKDSFGASSGVSDWYSRNIYMFYNLNRIVGFDVEEERILIIVGQGHKAILQDLIEDAPYYEYVDVLDYLR